MAAAIGEPAATGPSRVDLTRLVPETPFPLRCDLRIALSRERVFPHPPAQLPDRARHVRVHCPTTASIIEWRKWSGEEQRVLGRILGLDLGKRRIGMAISDPLRITAQGLPTLERTNMRQDLAILARLMTEREVTRVVLGNPLNMSGKEGRQSGWARAFASDLQGKTGVPVELWDERLTSVEAGRVLRQSGISIEKRGRAVDRLAAVILLQSYLDCLPIEPEPEEREAGTEE
jgi:putative holliday junction resolvase